MKEIGDKTNITLDELMNAFAEYVTGGDLIATRELSKISTSIATARSKAKLTQKEFAKNIGVTQGMISKWESGEYNFTIEGLSDICDKLNLNLNIEISEKIVSSLTCPESMPKNEFVPIESLQKNTLQKISYMAVAA